MSSKSKKKPDALEWTVWPAARRPHAAAAAIVLVLAVSWYGYVGFGSIAYSVIALVVLTASLAFFLFPSTYRLDREGVEVTGFLHRRRKPWDDLACFIHGEDYIAVSISANPTERSISRGFVLRLADNGDEVAAHLSRHIPEWKPPAEDEGEGDE